jgi:hypothetical protein
LLAARKLQLAEVPVIVLDHLTEAQKRAYILADNQLALNAGWDDTLLAAELAALQNEDFNLDLIGFEDQELARLGRLTLGGPNVGALLASAALFAGFRLVGSRLRGSGLFDSCVHVISFRGNRRGVHINHSGAPKMQVNSRKNRE